MCLLTLTKTCKSLGNCLHSTTSGVFRCNITTPHPHHLYLTTQLTRKHLTCFWKYGNVQIMHINDVKHLFQRDGVFYYVRRAPVDVPPHNPSNRIPISLTTKSACAAVRASKSINQRFVNTIGLVCGCRI